MQGATLLKKFPYRPLPSGDGESLEDDQCSSSLAFANYTKYFRCFILYYTQLARLTWPLLVIASIWTYCLSTRAPALLECLRTTSAYSPAFRAVELYDTDFANGFIEKSKYRGPPTAELEQLWFDLWNQAEVLIPSDRMAALNRTDLSDYMRAPDGEGDGYVGGLEVFHQLHCLNYLRQYTWQLAGAYKEGNSLYAPKGSRKELRIHADHCIESLRITLMCHGDVSPVLIKMDNHYDPPRPSAEFSSHHRCRNFEQIMAWNEDHGLSTFNNPHHSHHHNHGGDE